MSFSIFGRNFVFENFLIEMILLLYLIFTFIISFMKTKLKILNRSILQLKLGDLMKLVGGVYTQKFTFQLVKVRFV